MSWKQESRKLVLIAVAFVCCFFLPVGESRFDNAVLEAFHLVRWYAREHVLLCLIPAFFIAGAISVFVSQASVMRYLGAKANKVLAYGVASISGSVLAVCSCTVLPLFAGIYRMGAGLGPACAFLYSGPAINILAIALTARILGPSLGIARAIGAVAFSVVIGLLMHMIFRREEASKAAAQAQMPHMPASRPLWQNAVTLGCMCGILVFANWAQSGDIRAIFLCCPNGLNTLEVQGRVVEKGDDAITVETPSGSRRSIPASQLKEVGPAKPNSVVNRLHRYRWGIVAVCLLALAVILGLWFERDERAEWVSSSWGFAKQILPLLLAGVLVAGLLLGRVGHEGLIPAEWVNRIVGGNSVRANLCASIVGAFMYFATLTEIPIVQGLIGNGMGKGPALALLLAGPALSLPNMLVIQSVMGTKKTVVFVSLVIAMATVSGIIYGTF